MASRKSVLLVGGSGTLGTHLAYRLRDTHKVFMTYHAHPIRIPGVTALSFNAVEVDKAKRLAYVANPEVIIYAAGKEDVLWAEKHDREAEHVHVGGIGGLLKLTTVFQPKVIYLSSCLAFDGSKGNYHETETLSPVSKLGKLKATAEGTVKGRASNYNIVRTSPILARGNGLNLSFLDRMRMTLARKKMIELSNNEVHSFAPVDGLLELVEKLIDSSVKNKVLHYGGLSKCTYFELGKLFAERFKYDPSLITEPQLGGATQMQRDQSLNTTETIKLMKIKPVMIEETFDMLEK